LDAIQRRAQAAGAAARKQGQDAAAAAAAAAAAGRGGPAFGVPPVGGVPGIGAVAVPVPQAEPKEEEEEREEQDKDVVDVWAEQLDDFDAKLRAATGGDGDGADASAAAAATAAPPLREWSVAQVGAALDGAGLGAHVDAFAAQRVDGATAAEMGAEELRAEFPTIPMGDRRRILALFAESE